MPVVSVSARFAPAVIAATAFGALASGSAYAAKPGNPPSSPVAVVITAPAAGATVPSTLLASGTALTSARGAAVASVQTSVDGGQFLVAAGTTSWSYSFSKLVAGGHTITARATDTKGNAATASVSVTVVSSTPAPVASPPTSTIASPRYAGAVISGVYTLEGASSDSASGVAKEQWAVDGAIVASGTSSYGLSYDWDTSTAARGSHTVTYTTWNAAGASASATSSVTVGSYSVKRVAVVLYRFSDQTPPMQPQQVLDWTFGPTRSVAGYYNEETYGRLLLGGQYSAGGDVLGFYTIPYTYAAVTSCDFTHWEGAALQDATAAGVDLNGYDVVMLTAAVPPGCGSGTGGGTQDRVPWNNPATVDQWITFAAHELGHSFGIHHHASSDTCIDSAGHAVQVSASCTSDEYGDPYDIMGSGQVQDMNMYEKGQIGVLRPGNAITVTAAGTYTLAPSTAPSLGVQSIRIPQSWDALGNPTNYYYLEFRQTSAYDVLPAGVVDYDGVQIRLAPDYAATDTVSKLIDATPGSITAPGEYDNWDGRLPAGQYFQDTSIGLTVKTVSVSSTGATVEIIMGTPQCYRATPTLTVSPSSQTITAGQTAYATISLTNNDSPACGPSTISVNSALPAGFAQNPASTTVTGMYPAGATSRWQIAVTPGATVAPGTYSLTETAFDAVSGAASAAPFNVSVG